MYTILCRGFVLQLQGHVKGNDTTPCTLQPESLEAHWCAGLCHQAIQKSQAFCCSVDVAMTCPSVARPNLTTLQLSLGNTQPY